MNDRDIGIATDRDRETHMERDTEREGHKGTEVALDI